MSEHVNKLKQISKPEIHLIGVSTRTTNAAEAGPKGRIPSLWESYFRGVAGQTANNGLIYGLYTAYESDATGEYTFFIGHEAGERQEQLPQSEAEQVTIPAAKYLVFTTEEGPVHQVVVQAWQVIWQYFEQNSAETRTFTGDFELYDGSQFDPERTTVQIYIAIK